MKDYEVSIYFRILKKQNVINCFNVLCGKLLCDGN